MPYATGEPTAEQISAVMEDFITLEGPLLPMLHGLQAEFGYVPELTSAEVFDLWRKGAGL